MTKKIYKFRTGNEAPKNADYLTTLIVGRTVFHYFSVEVKDKKSKAIKK